MNELIKRLREEAGEWCANCCYKCGDNVCGAPNDRKKDCDIYTKLYAADVIEKLLAIQDEDRHNYDLAEKDIERLEELVPSWISVEKEGLPKESGEQIVFLHCGDNLLDPQFDGDLSYVTSMYYDADNCIWDDGTCRYNGILDAVNKPYTYYVTHWIPLPQSPKEEI